MRLLQLHPGERSGEDDGGGTEPLDLHPLLTVVTGLSAAGRELVRRSASALPAGDDAGCTGLLESHGIFLDLTNEVLSLLELDRAVDVVIRPEDLRSVDDEDAAAGGRAGEVDLEAFVEQAPPGRYPELDDATAERQDAREALSILRDAADRVRAELDEAARRRRRADAALAAARDAADGPGELGLGADDFGSSVAGASAQRDALTARTTELEAELERIDRGIEELRAIDTRPIQVLLDAIRDPTPVEYVVSDRAVALADDFERLQGEVASLEAALEAKGQGPGSAMVRLDRARGDVAAAERAMRKPELSPEQVAELEAAHEEVVNAETKAAGALVGRRAAERRLEVAREREQAILDHVGYPTWSSYVMGASLWSVDPQTEERLERAKFELEAAEANWAEVTAEMQAHPQHAELLNQLEEVYLEAVDLLGGDPETPDLAGALRDLRVAVREVTTDELVEALSYQLELVGIDLGARPVLDTAVAVADAFLAEAAGVTERIGELEAERAGVDAELGRIDRELHEADQAGAAAGKGAAEPSTSSLAPEAREHELAARERELAEATEAEHEAAEMLDARMALVDAAIQMEGVATARCKRLAQELATGEAGPDVPPAAEELWGKLGAESAPVVDGDGDQAQESLELYLLARLADVRAVSFAGSVPVVLDDALAEQPPGRVRTLLAKLEHMADAVQVIYLSDDPTVTSWAEEVGFERAAVVQAPPSFS